MTKNKQQNLIASVKNLNTGFISKYVIGLNSEMGCRGYSVLVNYQSLNSILFPLAPSPIIFLYKIWMKQITPCEFYLTIRFYAYDLPASKQKNNSFYH